VPGELTSGSPLLEAVPLSHGRGTT
jgi:hypothetical protein